MFVFNDTATTEIYTLSLHDALPISLTGATRRAEPSIKDSKIDEIIRVHPIQASLIANDEAVLGVAADGKPKYICPRYEDRDSVFDVPACPKCGCECFNAFLETNSVPYGGPLASPKKIGRAHV